MKLTVILCTVLALQMTHSNAQKSYEGYKTYRVNFGKDQIEELRSLVDSIEGLEFFKFSSALGIADVFTPPDKEEILLSSLKKINLEYSLLNSDIQKWIDEES